MPQIMFRKIMITFYVDRFFEFVDDGLVVTKNNLYNRILVVFCIGKCYVWLVAQAVSFLVSGLNVNTILLKTNLLLNRFSHFICINHKPNQRSQSYYCPGRIRNFL